MKQTIELEGNRKAVVEIPYSKLTSNSSTPYQQASHCCDSKVVLVGCGGCPSKGRQNNAELKAIISELEESYDKDVKQLQDRIGELQRERESLKKTHGDELVKLRVECEGKIQQKAAALELLRGECRRKDSQIAVLLNEKEIIIKNKINEFKQNQYIDKINELQSLLRLKEHQIKELTIRLENSQQERVRGEEVRAQEQGKWEREVSSLKFDLAQLQEKYQKERNEQELELQRKREEWLCKLSSYESRLQQTDKQHRNNKVQFESIQGTLKNQVESHLKANESLKAALKKEEEKGDKLQSDMLLALQDIKQLKTQNLVLVDKLEKSEEALLIIDSQKGNLLLQLQNKNEQIEALKLDLANKEKVYEVKIQRVIDGKPQIEELRGVITELEMQLKEFNQEKETLLEEVRKRQLGNEELRATIGTLETELTELKAYIEKREGSFKWAVEREIERDISVSEAKSNYYKVSKVREYVREVPSQNDKAAFDRISAGIQGAFNIGIPEQIIFTPQNQSIPQ